MYFKNLLKTPDIQKDQRKNGTQRAESSFKTLLPTGFISHPEKEAKKMSKSFDSRQDDGTNKS